MEASKMTSVPSAPQTPSTLASPRTLTSPVSPRAAASKAKSSSTERKSGTTSSQTPGPSPFGHSSPSNANKRPHPLSRTQTQTTGGGIFTPQGPTTANQSPSREPVDETARTDALWAEMRATLADVELSATRGTEQTHFFGQQHAKALEELRNAQIGLAQAWARADGDAGDETINEQAGRNESEGDGVSPGGSVKNHDEPPLEKGSRHRSSSAASSGSISLDASSLAAEKDIATARLRREANDRYFYRVSKGVMDVVSKLEEVASAMGKVEKESRSVWSSDEDSEDQNSDQYRASANDGKKRAEKDSK